MDNSVVDFYDDLAEDYHLVFGDWEASIQRQAEKLDTLIRYRLPEREPPLSVLDCSCGIGTQSLGLAERGYRVHGTDISAKSIERARQEAASRNLDITFAVADFRYLQTQVEGTYDIVLSCDNAVPHLIADGDLYAVAHSMKTRLKPGGLLLISMRDYDHELRERRRTTTPYAYEHDGGKRIIFQAWDWIGDTPVYRLHHFIVKQHGEEWETLHRETEYRAIRRDELTNVLEMSGFINVRWHMPADTGFYQPIVTAHAPAEI